jgi:hypothetical protein
MSDWVLKIDFKGAGKMLALMLHFGDFVGKHTTSQGVPPAEILVSHQNIPRFYPIKIITHHSSFITHHLA